MTKILVADDNDDLRDLITLFLVRAGYDVTAVPDGMAAWTEIQARRYDLVVLDNTMPRMTGIEVLVACRDAQMADRPPVIMLSALRSRHDVEAGLDAGADAYMTKPFTCAGLIGQIDTLLGRGTATAM
ncbi:response regulator transcription factor [Nocardioides rubriscoriae]|uniref:response regulator transcription factor n=1 Tax=Nocardioides rubriscoriae TaxID=642762 RepID=UPI0011E00267|nr:response regulator transcription factor [Nocardioides rubriscoriae]